MKKLMIRCAPLLFLGLLPTSPQAKEKAPHMPTSVEMAMLPEYCQARLEDGTKRRDQWNQRIGPTNFIHLHHYCVGLNYLNRAKLDVDKRIKRRNLQTAIRGFDYVLQRWPKSFPLTKEAQNQKTLAETMLKFI